MQQQTYIIYADSARVANIIEEFFSRNPQNRFYFDAPNPVITSRNGNDIEMKTCIAERPFKHLFRGPILAHIVITKVIERGMIGGGPIHNTPPICAGN